MVLCHIITISDGCMGWLLLYEVEDRGISVGTQGGGWSALGWGEEGDLPWGIGSWGTPGWVGYPQILGWDSIR